jgi:dTDP-4-amino-4,6-dideoxygalactose transaminase
MGFLLGRFERTANEFYGDFRANEERFGSLPVMAMSRLTRNLLHGIDYAAVERRRRENFAYLHERLKDRNGLALRQTGTFMYPLLLDNGKALRKKLQAEKIYIPTLWPDVFQMSEPGSTEYAMAENILPLPIDQRYTTEDMAYMLDRLEQLL